MADKDLTRAELENLELMGLFGLRREAVASFRGCGVSTVDKQLSSAKLKMNATDRNSLFVVSEALRIGLIPAIGPRRLGQRFNLTTPPMRRPETD